jgi:hypothetical protein
VNGECATCPWRSDHAIENTSVTIQLAQNGFGNPRFIGNSFASGSGPGGSPSSTSTQANVDISGSGGSGGTSGGLGDNAGTVQYGSATTTVTVTASATEFRIHVTGTGDMNAPAGYTNLAIGASLSFFDTAIAITGAGNIPYTIQKTGDLAGVTWNIVPEPGTGASLGAGTLTAGSYLFDQGGSAPSLFYSYNFGNGGSGNVHRSIAGDFIITVGAQPTGVCCRGATCNASISQAACTPVGNAGAIYLTGSSCNAASNFRTPCCHADYDKSGVLSVPDIFSFLNDWFAGRPAAIIGGDGISGAFSVQQIFTFLNDWFAGC